MLSYAEPEELDRIAALRRRTAAATAANEDLDRIAALRRKTAAAPSWSQQDEEELAQLRRKATQELPPTVTPDGSFNTQDEADTPHSSIDDFALERSIGKGAFGEVFLATSKLTGRVYAVKTIPRSKAGDERRALLAVRHPFVVRLRWVLYDSADAWLVMDYAPRGTLASHLERRPGRRLPIAHARLVSAELASALLALHAAGVVHRDVKPSNILVDGAGHCLLADLGLAATRASMLVPVHRSNVAAHLRHRRDACSTAWRCGSLAARLDQHGRVLAERELSAPDSLVDLRAGVYVAH